mmetsp:Transcript_60310/g.141089  ORF Transcript_60310/g.141089 Transcript_60310/m.141089 type:complete len:229 (+) Transcript_60310:832-1518(+)
MHNRRRRDCLDFRMRRCLRGWRRALSFRGWRRQTLQQFRRPPSHPPCSQHPPEHMERRRLKGEPASTFRVPVSRQGASLQKSCLQRFEGSSSLHAEMDGFRKFSQQACRLLAITPLHWRHGAETVRDLPSRRRRLQRCELPKEHPLFRLTVGKRKILSARTRSRKRRPHQAWVLASGMSASQGLALATQKRQRRQSPQSLEQKVTKAPWWSLKRWLQPLLPPKPDWPG